MNLGFLASHGGSNMQAIINACRDKRLDAVPTVVISNNGHSGAMEKAKAESVPSYHLSSHTCSSAEALDETIYLTLRKHEVDVVILAGYMKKLGPKLLKGYQGAILNIHPSLLPKFGGQGMYGMRVHEAVIAAGESESGATVHLVDGEYDTGPVLKQRRVNVLDHDTADSLAKKVLEQEHVLYPEVLQQICAGIIQIPGYITD